MGVTDWAGTETSPGTPSFDYNANDGHAEAMTPRGSPSGPRLGRSFEAMHLHRRFLEQTHSWSLVRGLVSVEVPQLSKSQQYILQARFLLHE